MAEEQTAGANDAAAAGAAREPVNPAVDRGARTDPGAGWHGADAGEEIDPATERVGAARAERAIRDAEVAGRDAEIAGQDAEIAGPEVEVSGRDAEIAGRDAEIAGQDAEVAGQEAEIGRLKDQILRAQAEAENVRRRAQRDVENAHKFALEKFCAELVPVIDSLEKAVDSARKGDGTDVAAIIAGIELSLRMFLGVMTKAGIEQVDPLGEPFDPQRHEAMAMVPNPNAEPNSVMDVMQKGYLLNGRLVRAAMVVVSKAPG